MAEHCLHEQDFGAIKETVHRLDKEVLGNGKPGLSETVHGMSVKVDNLIVSVDGLRTVVSGLAKFEAGMKAMEDQKGKGFTKTLQVLMFVVAVGSLLVAFTVMNKQTERRVIDMIDQYGYTMNTRSADTLNIL